MVVESPEKRT